MRRPDDNPVQPPTAAGAPAASEAGLTISTDIPMELPRDDRADRRAWLRGMSRWVVLGALALCGGMVTARRQWAQWGCLGPTACGDCSWQGRCRLSRLEKPLPGAPDRTLRSRELVDR